MKAVFNVNGTKVTIEPKNVVKFFDLVEFYIANDCIKQNGNMSKNGTIKYDVIDSFKFFQHLDYINNED